MFVNKYLPYIFVLLPCLKKKKKRSSCPFVPKRAVKRKTGNSFNTDWADKHRASNKGSYYKQHKFKEGQDLEEAAIVSSSHVKLLSKAMLGSDNELNESEVFDGKEEEMKTGKRYAEKQLFWAKH